MAMLPDSDGRVGVYFNVAWELISYPLRFEMLLLTWQWIDSAVEGRMVVKAVRSVWQASFTGAHSSRADPFFFIFSTHHQQPFQPTIIKSSSSSSVLN